MHLLKEWNIVCDALGDGRQILLARKGGILDDAGLFVPAHEEFFLFPTLLHQKEQWNEALKPDAIERIPLLSPASTDTVELSVFCRMTDAVTVTDPLRLHALDGEHVWTSRFLEKRLLSGSEKSLTILLVRAYRVSPPFNLPMRPSYAGCKSWVETAEQAPTGLLPALSEDLFSHKRAEILRALGK